MYIWVARDLVRSDWFLQVYFAMFDLDSNTHAILFLNDDNSAMSIKTFTSRVSVEREKHIL